MFLQDWYSAGSRVLLGPGEFRRFDAVLWVGGRRVKTLSLSLLAFAAAVGVARAEPGTTVKGFAPYHSASGWARDLVAAKPMEPVRLVRSPYLTSEKFDPASYSAGRFIDQSRAIPLELGIAAGTIAVVGLGGWHWGDSKFHFETDCWFCADTHTGGVDKAGHMFTGYIITDLLAQRIKANAADPAGAEITAAVYAMGLMTGIEVLDGFTKKYGFSKQDLAADAIGVALGIARNAVPGMREKIDFRIMYTPSSYERPGVGPDHFQVIPPYNRTRYIAAIKASGFEFLQDTPLRYFELHAGFDARGYTSKERNLGYPKEQNLYNGFGLNLNELLFGKGSLPNFAAHRDTEWAWAVSNTLERVQIPYTSVYSGRN